MALTLNELYTATQSTYHLTLICGAPDLDQIMNWVYVSEDLNTSEFLKGGELIITTGVSSHDSSWLFLFIQKLVDQKCSGLIINIGKYLFNEDITDEIQIFCNEHHFPVFTMPWEVHLYDITRDYYNRIFIDSQTDNFIMQAFFSILKMDLHMVGSVATLEDYGYLPNDCYCICALGLPLTSNTTTPALNHEKPIFFLIQRFLKSHHLDCQFALYRTCVLCIFHNTEDAVIEQSMELLHEKLLPVTTANFPIGIGSQQNSLTALSKTYRQAMSALTMCTHQHISICNYKSLGFFQLLLEVNDEHLLARYVQDALGPLIAYDREHSSNYLETLECYLKFNGSIQAISSEMFCHRNTINYRIKSIRKTLNCDLNQPDVCFQLRTACFVREYLQLIHS